MLDAIKNAKSFLLNSSILTTHLLSKDVNLDQRVAQQTVRPHYRLVDEGLNASAFEMQVVHECDGEELGAAEFLGLLNVVF
jgi:hypothetical protein